MSEAKSANNGVYFLSLELENVRCFGKKQKLDLSDGKGNYAKWTVILGDNGMGKTTLLRCLAAVEPEPIEDYDQDEDETVPYCLKYLNNKNEELFFGKNVFSVVCSLSVDVDEVVEIEFEKGSCTAINDNKIRNLKLYGYGATRRLKKSTSLSKISDTTATLFDGKAELINPESWLLRAHHAAEVNQKFKKNFLLVEEILKILLPDVTEIKVFFPDINKPELQVNFFVNNIWLEIDSLSLGYQTMITWIVDLAANLCDRYPNSPNPIAEPAVVLIDEIDLHLHPKWQREIMRYLSERFINTQFIVTAHSPLIVQAAEDENANIVVLRREGDEVIIDQQHKAIHGWRVDQLLASDLFGLEGSRSKKYEDLLTQRRAILGKSKLTAHDKKELKRLDLEMGDIPTAETPEDIKAMDIIRRAAKLLEAEND